MDQSECKKTILVVEDEMELRNLLRQVFDMKAYRILEACDGLEALEVSHAYQGHIGLMLTDFMIPRLDGASLMEEIRVTRPDIKVLFMSGTSPHGEEGFEEAINLSGSAFLPKPFRLHSLLEKIEAMLNG